MAKREFVEKNDLKNTLLPVEGHMSAVDMIINRCNVFTEKDIVMPYFNALKAKMKERDDNNGGEPLNAVDKGYHLACEHLYEEADGLLSHDVGGAEDTITISEVVNMLKMVQNTLTEEQWMEDGGTLVVSLKNIESVISDKINILEKRQRSDKDVHRTVNMVED